MRRSSTIVRFAQSLAMATLLSSTAVASLAAPTAQEIMQKSAATMKSSKTYQAVMGMTTSMGQMGSMSLNIDIKKSGEKMSVTTSPSGQATGQMAMGAAFATMHMVSDGKTTWTYMPAMKQYFKQAATPSQGNQFDPTQMYKDPKGMNMNMKLVGTENVGGKPAYVIEMSPKTAGKGPKQTMHFYVDQATYHFKQMKMSMNMGALAGKAAGPGAGAPPPMTMNMTMVVKSEKIDQPIPDSEFKFTPPPGATEAKGGMGGMMGGMAGGARRPAKK
jgi:outer membrane lipoprotein-sorting protein